MTLNSGSRLGAYEIGAPLGAGGMGEVYRARDTRLGRSVAIKVLPAAFATDPERVARFEREAKLLAALNHPHIAALYGMETTVAGTFLVMELVEGDTLAERLKRGPMALSEVLRIGLQIAEALEAAHERGIIHRDLKPANIKAGLDDRVKVLDFGLAKAMDTEPAGAAANVTHSPTLSMATVAGVILGTAAYMSPEQAKGLPADHRSDVFSFGVVLYEMLTGRQPFQGETAPDILASVLAREADLAALPPSLPPRLVDLLKRCLEKQPRKRWQAVGDVRAELESVSASPNAVVAPPVILPVQPLWRRAIPIAAAAVVAALATAAAFAALRRQPSPSVTRLAYAMPSGQAMPGGARRMIALSPDGSQLAYAANGRLYLRSLAEFEGRPLQGADLGAINAPGQPTFSPDGRWIAFLATVDRRVYLRKIATSGGAPVNITSMTTAPQVNLANGLSWNNDEILFASAEGIMRVNANGGTPSVAIAPTTGEQMLSPQRLPGTDVIIFTIANGGITDSWDKAQIVAHSLKTGERKTLVSGGSDATYVATGHLVYALAGVLFGVRFDKDAVAVLGGPVPVVEGVRRGLGAVGIGTAQYAIANSGTLAYVPGPLTTTASAGAREVVINDRQGISEKLKLAPGMYSAPRISPDGKRLALIIEDGKDASVWIYDLAGTSAIRRLTFGARDRFPVWSPDGQRVAFQSDRDGDPALFVAPASGGTPERLTKAAKDESHVPESWWGDRVLYSSVRKTRVTLWNLDLRAKSALPFGGVESGYALSAMFSPDGRWVAYATSDGFVSTVFVQPFPANGTRYQISRADEDGHHPLWSPDGRELSYLPAPGRFVVVDVSTSPSFTVGNPVSLPRRFSLDNAPTNVRSHDITSDGKRFLGLAPPMAAGETNAGGVSEIRIVLNWTEELKQRAPLR